MSRLSAETVAPPDVGRHRLANGLQVLVLRDPRLPLVTLDIWYHVGSRHDPPERSGLAHLFEHMLFQGSKHVRPNEHFARIQQVGGVANGSTWYDRTNYYETLPVQALELGMWLESDRMGFLLDALDGEKLELQRNVVMNERRQRVDNQPYGRAGERLNQLLYGEHHPYSRPVIGWMEDIEAASLEDLEQFFLRYYAPHNAVLVIAGDVEEDDAVALAERYFGPIGERFEEVNTTSPSQPPAPRPQRTHETLEDQVATGRVTLAWCVEGYGAPSWYAANVAASVLARGKSARLEATLVRDLELATGVSAYVLPTECCATFAVVLSARPEADLERLRHTAEDVIVRLLADEPPREDEVKRCLAGLLADHHFGQQSLQPRADAIARGATFLDEPERVFREADLLAENATPDAVNSMLAQLDPKHTVSVTVMPRTTTESQP